MRWKVGLLTAALAALLIAAVIQLSPSEEETEDVQIVGGQKYIKNAAFKTPKSPAKFKTYYPAVTYTYPGLTKTVVKGKKLSSVASARVRRLRLSFRRLAKRISRFSAPSKLVFSEVESDRNWLLDNLKSIRKDIEQAKLELERKKGAIGKTGRDGSRGPLGPRGYAGEKGATGLRGPRGVPGISGLAGNPGLMGPEGVRGPTGKPGARGPTGVSSVLVGPEGNPGKRGPNGTPGKNTIGHRGPPGPPGAPGATGPPGAIGARGSVGKRGPPGVWGADGTDGRDGTSLEGAKGADGSDGAAGPRGVAGLPGAQGRAGGEKLVPGAVEEMWYLGGDTPNLALPFTHPNQRWLYTASVIDINDPSAFALPGGRRELFALRYTGLVKINNGGNYRFFLSSDDGSKLYIDGRLVVNNDGLHGAQERAGDIQLGFGLHKFQIDFFQNYGGGSLRFLWEGPGVSKSLVSVFQPKSADRAALMSRPMATYGFHCEVRRFGGQISSLNGLFNGGPASTKDYTTPFINFPDANSFEAGTSERFSTLYTGYIYAPYAGRYQFWMVSDDGSQFFIDNNLVINNDGLHPPQWRDGAMDLGKGNHAIKVLFFQNGGGGSLRVDWAGPNIARGFMPVFLTPPPNE